MFKLAMLTCLVIFSFFDVEIKPNSLVVIDIDETLAKYEGINPTWWNNTIETHFTIHNDYNMAQSNTYNMWKHHIHTSLPTHTDMDGFFNLVDRVEELSSDLIFVTARDDTHMRDITMQHLEHLGIVDKHVSFSSHTNKVPYIGEYIELNKKSYDKIIFIDDNDKNLNDVKTHFVDDVECYKFVM
jgi:predicted secreted acid phosphatase